VHDWPAFSDDEHVVLTIVKSSPTAVFLIVSFDDVPLFSVTLLEAEVWPRVTVPKLNEGGNRLTPEPGVGVVVGVNVGSCVAVAVRVGVAVAVTVTVGVAIPVAVRVGVAVLVTVAVGVTVRVAVAVLAAV
jgi:hypothetical protein